MKSNNLLEDYQLWKIIKDFGICKILFNYDSVPAYILTVLISYVYLSSKDFFEMTKDITLALIGADAALLGVIIAGFAISVSMLDKNFLLFLKRFDLYNELIFQFVFTSGIISIGLMATIGLSLSLPFEHWISMILFVISILFTLWGVLSIALLLVVFLKDLAVLKGHYSELPDREN